MSETKFKFKTQDNRKLTLKKKLTFPKVEIQKDEIQKDEKRKDEKRKDETKSTIVLIDGSYFIFRRYCATKVWYSQHTEKGASEDCNIENEDFVKHYTKHFGDWVNKINKEFKPDELYWFKDSPKDTVWRTPLFKEYKSHRDDLCPPHVGKFFAYSYQDLIPANKVILVDTAEADDSLAIAAKFENKTRPSCKIVIFTGDTDYLQLVNDRTRVVNFKGPKLVDIPLEVKLGKKDGKQVKELVASDIYLTIKILLGDKTDGIPGVPGCGPATAYKLATDSEYFTQYINNNPTRKNIYEKNRLLISFDEIPVELKNEIERVYQQIKDNK